MTIFYCDISAIGNEYQAYADTPTTWAVPQDGNGLAGPGHAAAVAIATIDCTGASASGTGTIGVMGVTVSSTLNASGAALATAIAAAINASSTAVSATYSALLLPLNRLVYARVNPGNSSQVQIMCRIAGTDWNGMTPTQANITGPASITAFTGGLNGPFGYWVNDAVVFGKGICTFGAMCGLSAGTVEPAQTDVVEVRSKRGASDLNCTVTSNAAAAHTIRPRNFLFDNGTIWTGDSGVFRFWIYYTLISSSGLSFSLPAGVGASVSFTSRGRENFEVGMATVSSLPTIVFCRCGVQQTLKFNRCRYVELAGNNGANIHLTHDGGTASNAVNWRCDLSDSRLIYVGTCKRAVKVDGINASVRIVAHNLNVEVIGATATLGVVIYTGGVNHAYVEWIGGSILDSNAVFKCPMPLDCTGDYVQLIIDGVAGVTDALAGFSASEVNMHSMWWNQTEGPDKGFRYECPQYIVDWKGDGTFPHCGAANLKAEEWSHRVTWNLTPSMYFMQTPLKLGYFYRGVDAVKTLTLELYVPDATTFYEDELALGISYVDENSILRSETAYGLSCSSLLPGRVAIAASAKVWTANGVLDFSPKKLVITTAHPVKSGSEITLRLSLAAPRSPSIVFYASPEIGVA